MRFLFSAFILFAFVMKVKAQSDTVPEPAAPLEHENTNVHSRYIYDTKYSEAILSLYNDSTYYYSFYACSWWKTEQGEWNVNKNAALVLKVGKVRSRKKPKERGSLKRHKLGYQQDVITAKFMKLYRDKAIALPYPLWTPPEPEPPKPAKPEKPKAQKEVSEPKCEVEQYGYSIPREQVLGDCNDIRTDGPFIDSIKAKLGYGAANEVFFYYPLLQKEGQKGVYHFWGKDKYAGLFFFDGAKFNVSDDYPLGDGPVASDDLLNSIGFSEKQLRTLENKLNVQERPELGL